MSGERQDPPPGDPEEAEIRAAIRSVRRGDRDAFARVINAYQRRLFGLALMMTRDPAAADEVAQDAFFRAFTHLDRYDDARPFYPWISTIVVRLAQNWLVARARVVRREGAELDAGTRVPAGGVDALAALITDENDRRLWQTVAALPSGERAAVMLHYRQDLGIREIASALGVTGGTIKTLLFRARRKLRHALDPAPAGKDKP